MAMLKWDYYALFLPAESSGKAHPEEFSLCYTEGQRHVGGSRKDRAYRMDGLVLRKG
jgi:hypothetical protein